MWTTHEVDECDKANIDMHGLFDTHRWTARMFDEAQQIDTSQGDARPKDKEMLTERIMNRTGFDVLNRKIAHVRKLMQRDWLLQTRFSEWQLSKDGCTVEWRYSQRWREMLDRVAATLGADVPREVGPMGVQLPNTLFPT